MFFNFTCEADVSLISTLATANKIYTACLPASVHLFPNSRTDRFNIWYNFQALNLQAFFFAGD